MPIRKIKTWLFHFFHFNKQERNGVFILCLIITALFAVRLLMPFFTNSTSPVQLISIHVNPKISFEKNEKQIYHGDSNIEKENDDKTTSPARFVFNPNTISQEDALQLGFSKKLSAVLINFRNKGGKFYKTEDLRKLYGLSPKLYNELEPYILIPNDKKEFKKDSGFATNRFPKIVSSKKEFVRSLPEINTADSLAIVYLKGIGPSFTKRIIKYRTMLGGFHSMDQLKEIYGMTDSLFILLSSQVKVDNKAITKIPINVIDLNSLRKHPYFNFQLAQAVINYRGQHGRLSENDIIKLGVFNENKLKLILPYLSY